MLVGTIILTVGYLCWYFMDYSPQRTSSSLSTVDKTPELVTVYNLTAWDLE